MWVLPAEVVFRKTIYFGAIWSYGFLPVICSPGFAFFAKANRNFWCLSVRKGFLTSANLLRPAFRSDRRTFSENIFSCQCDCGIYLLHLGLVFIASYTPYELLDVAKNPLQVCIIFCRQNENFWRIFSLGQQRFQLPLKSTNMLHLMYYSISSISLRMLCHINRG